jgi:hypothetical protein
LRGGVVAGEEKRRKKNPPHTYMYVPSVASKQITCNTYIYIYTHTHIHGWEMLARKRLT